MSAQSQHVFTDGLSNHYRVSTFHEQRATVDRLLVHILAACCDFCVIRAGCERTECVLCACKLATMMEICDRNNSRHSVCRLDSFSNANTYVPACVVLLLIELMV